MKKSILSLHLILLLVVGVTSIFGDHSLSFDGVDDYVSIPSSTSISTTFDGLNPFTISSWVKTVTIDGYQEIWSKGYESSTTPDNREFVCVKQPGELSITFVIYEGNDLANRIGIYASEILELNAWVNVTISYDGGTNHNSLKVYKNGILHSTTSQDVGSFTTGITPTSDPLEFGRFVHNTPWAYWNGLMDNTTLWNYALSEDEIQDIQYSNYNGTETGMIGYWKFDQGSGEIASDSSGNDNHGSVIGSTWSTDVPIMDSPPEPIVNHSISFDGSSYVELTQNMPHANLSELSIQLWVKNDWSDDQEYFLDFGALAGNPQPFVYRILQQNGSLMAWVEGTALANVDGDRNVEYPVTNLIPGNWVNVAITLTSNTIKLYVDGQVVDVGSFDYSGNYDMFTNQGVYVFGKNGGASMYTDASLDDISVWNYALNQSELQTNMNSQLYGDELGLIGHWGFNEGIGLTIDDATLSDNSGTIVGNAAWSTDVPELSTAPVTIILNEIMNNPSAVDDTDGEWFELYNAGGVDINLDGWTLSDLGSDIVQIQGTVTIPSGGYAVIGNNGNISSNGGVELDYQYSTLYLSNSDDEIILRNPEGITIDSVAWDGGPNFPDPTGASMALFNPALDNSIGSNWAESSTPFGLGDLGTPGLPNFLSNIVVDQMVLEFDTVFVAESGELSVTISNVGNAPLLIDSLYTNSSLFNVSFSDSLIETTAELQITFTPTEFGNVSGTLYISSNDPDEGLVEIPLSGFGYYLSPDIELESTSIVFGGVMDGLTGVEVFHIYNIGEELLELDSIYCTENFSVSESNGNVAPGESLSLEVSFLPDDEISFSGALTIVSGNDPDEDTLSVNLSGVGTAQSPIILLSTEILDFGTEVVTNDTTSLQLTIYNRGILPLVIHELDITNYNNPAVFWTEFEDAEIQQNDSVIVVISFSSPDSIYYASSKITVYSNAGNIDVSVGIGTAGKIEDTTIEALSTDTLLVPISCNLSQPVNGIQFNLTYNSDIVELINVQNNQPGAEDWEIYITPVGLIIFYTITNENLIPIGHQTPLLLQMMITSSVEAVETIDFLEPIYASTEGVITIPDFLFRSGDINIVYDNTPPTIPTGLQAEVDNNILITWSENSENDISYYVLDKSADEDFITDQYSSISTSETSYIDTAFEDGQTLYYRLSAVDSTGNVSDYSEVISIEAVVGIENSTIPKTFILNHNYPNPFNPSTTIRYGLPEDSIVSMVIYDVRGQVVKMLDSEHQSAGWYDIVWNGETTDGKTISTGIYFARLVAGDNSQVIKMLYLK
jgi:hypothetical protein